MSAAARVAAVIPTHDRPQLVRRAVESVLAQTVPVDEVIVVVGGPDPDGATARALSAFDDPRLKILPLGEGRSGPSAARNAGVAAATSPWIAFLDDDDEWCPTRIERQIEALAEAGWPGRAVVSTGVVARSPTGDYRWPHRFITRGESVGEYLFSTRTPLQGEALLHTSTLLTSRKLLLDEPFDETMWNHEDWDWLVRADASGAEQLAVEDHLVVWHIEQDRPGLTATTGDWERSLAWAERQRCRLGGRAFSGFCLTVVAGRARASGSARGVARALAAAFRGAPRLRNLAWFPLFAVLTPDRRRRLRAVASRNSLERAAPVH